MPGLEVAEAAGEESHEKRSEAKGEASPE